MAVISLAELGRHDEAAELQVAMDRFFKGRTCWVFSRLADWSRSVSHALSKDRAVALESLATVAEDTARHDYWCWGRWMLADLAESAVYAGNDAFARRAQDLLQSDPAPPAGPSHDGLRSFVAGASPAAGTDPADAAAALEDAASHFRVAGWRCSRVVPWHCSGPPWLGLTAPAPCRRSSRRWPDSMTAGQWYAATRRLPSWPPSAPGAVAKRLIWSAREP
jgi:hypothetical protein